MENKDKIDLAGFGQEGIVDKNMPYLERANLLVEIAKKFGKGRRDKEYNDDKFFINVKGIESLVGAGAEIGCLNEPHGKNYYNQVRYKEHVFIATTTKPHEYTICQTLAIKREI